MAWQVTDKDADGVLDEIESAIFQAAASILAGQGFSYRCPPDDIGMDGRIVVVDICTDHV